MIQTTSINIEHFFNEAFQDLKIDANRKELLNGIALYIAQELSETNL